MDHSTLSYRGVHDLWFRGCVRAKERCNYSLALQNVLCKATLTHSQSRTTRAQWVCSEAENKRRTGCCEALKAHLGMRRTKSVQRDRERERRSQVFRAACTTPLTHDAQQHDPRGCG